eukprot:CAMPEP_0181345532 /NCGR_PEP_ID=MMETSP1101-20121128/32800_1 /TAXON_ID=46948 /ORGANISM="Rhodomonas abbreviata, Strain Caron Lab Isolate" /LENGTH=152 /DNA_ID=CAMNT_0023457495 /DNA_START=393 /DNA_END=851 /DNA_ORIENTATION=-
MPGTTEQPCICVALFFTCYFDNKRACYCCGSVKDLKAAVVATESETRDLENIMMTQLDAPGDGDSEPSSRASASNSRQSTSRQQPAGRAQTPTGNGNGGNAASSRGGRAAPAPAAPAPAAPAAPAVAVPRGNSIGRIPEASAVVVMPDNLDM